MSQQVNRLPRIEQLSLDACLAMAHPENPKEHDVDKLIGSFQRFGFTAFPTIDEKTKVMVAGHGRCKALRKMRDHGYPPPTGIEVEGLDWRVPVIRGISFANEQERDAYILADNQHTMGSGWNAEKLTGFLTRLEDTESRFEGLGFDADELGALGFSYEPPSTSGGILDDRFDDAGLPEEPETGGDPKTVTVEGHTRRIGHAVRPPAQMTHDDWKLHLGDALEVLRTLPDNSVDSIVTDPPSGISFMGKDWDDDKGGRDKWIEWLSSIMREAQRVLKPGGHGLAWALPRTSHWTGMAIEGAGFEIRDRVSHIFGSGFPKNLDISKAVDDKLGVERPVIGEIDQACGVSERADGWGTALKPAMEDWWLFRKPLTKTVAETFIEHGTGGINIGECRIGDEERFNNPSGGSQDGDEVYALGIRGKGDGTIAVGRWPAHIAFSHTERCKPIGTKEDERTVRTGERIGDDSRELAFGMGKQETVTTTREMIAYECPPDCPVRLLDEQKEGASRFFYCAKPSKAETEAGLDDLPIKSGGELTDRKDGSDGLKNPRAGAGRGGGRRNTHPTKKPIELMRWLIRLVTPRGGIVLDMFTGSGTTALAALVEGCRFLGCELKPEYHEIASARIRSIIDDPRAIENADAEEQEIADGEESASS